MSRLVHARRIVSMLVGAFCLVLAGRAVFACFARGDIDLGAIVLISGLLALGGGLILSHFWARRFTAAVCLVMALIFPFGYINPFNAMEMRNPPDVKAILMWMVPLVCGLLSLAWLIDPPRQQSPPKTPGAT